MGLIELYHGKRRSARIHLGESDAPLGPPKEVIPIAALASSRERLEAAGRRGIELGPVDLLLEAMIGFIADGAFAA